MTATPDLPALIARVRELDEAATPGPWHSEPYYRKDEKSLRNDGDRGCDGIWADNRHDEIVTTDSAVYGPTWADARLMVEYRSLAPLLATALEEQMTEVERLKAFAEHVAYASQPVSMSAADCCAYYERRARSALEGNR